MRYLFVFGVKISACRQGRARGAGGWIGGGKPGIGAAKTGEPENARVETGETGEGGCGKPRFEAQPQAPPAGRFSSIGGRSGSPAHR